MDEKIKDIQSTSEVIFQDLGSKQEQAEEMYTQSWATMKKTRQLLNDLEETVKQLFGPRGATITVDVEWQKVYLAVWVPNPEAETKLNQYLEETYDDVKVNYVLRDMDYNYFYNSRKIDNSKIRAYCREQLTNGEEVK